MRRMHIKNVIPNAKLAKTVFSQEGKVLLTSGIQLKENHIDKIKTNGITYIYIDDGDPQNIEVEDDVCEQTRLEAIQVVNRLVGNYNFSHSINSGRILEIINKIMDELLSNRDILANLSCLKSVDDYTFEHSVNVCVLSLITGIGLGYNMLRLTDLGVGAILHDIGKLRVPEEILKKPSRLTVEEFEEIKKHTVYGYEILKDSENISMISAFIAFGHHERYDGSGYPLQLKGENIHQCARIVAVADVYDALTSDRVYRKKLKAREVIEYITSLSTHHFDIEIVESFAKYVALYPVGMGVVLNTKEQGIVVKVNKNLPTRPVVRVVYNENKEKLSDFYEIDLSKKLNMFIADSNEV